jgi:hypothetical protein
MKSNRCSSLSSLWALLCVACGAVLLCFAAYNLEDLHHFRSTIPCRPCGICHPVPFERRFVLFLDPSLRRHVCVFAAAHKDSTSIRRVANAYGNNRCLLFVAQSRALDSPHSNTNHTTAPPLLPATATILFDALFRQQHEHRRCRHGSAKSAATKCGD